MEYGKGKNDTVNYQTYALVFQHLKLYIAHLHLKEKQ